MVYTYDYDNQNYNPSLPVIEIQVGRAGTTPTFVVTALVDSGADATIIPLPILKRLRARKGEKAVMRGTTPGRIPVDLCYVALELPGYHHAHLPIVGDLTNNEVILGRDVLNHLVVTLNGLASVVELNE